MSKILVKFQWGHPQRGAKYTWGKRNLRVSTTNSIQLGNGRKYLHSYYSTWNDMARTQGSLRRGCIKTVNIAVWPKL